MKYYGAGTETPEIPQYDNENGPYLHTCHFYGSDVTINSIVTTKCYDIYLNGQMLTGLISMELF